MKVYDIALMLIRAIVVLDLIREVESIVTVVIRGAYVLQNEPNNRDYLLPLEVADLISPVLGIIISLVILGFSRQIARFAARIAGPIDTAGEFH